MWQYALSCRWKRAGSTKFGMTAISFFVSKFFTVSSRSQFDTAVTPSETSMPNFVIGR